MTEDRDRGEGFGDAGGVPEPHHVKVTDRRRVRPDAPPDAAATEGGGVSGSGGSSATEGSGRSEAPPAEGDAPAQEAETAAKAADLEQARRQAAEYKEHLQRLQAEFDNYRKRVLREQTRSVELAAEPLMRRLLEVLDEFDLALMAAEDHPDFDRFLHGVQLVYVKLQDILRAEGLEPIEAQGKAFDPNLHEALMQAGSGDEDGEPVVADVLRRGYRLKGRVLRPAGVKVSRVATEG